MSAGWREFATAADVPQDWWPQPGEADPRRTQPWSQATSWPNDGISYVGGTTRGLFTAIRRITPPGGWSWMNAVEVCGGTFREVKQDPADIAAARSCGRYQIVAAVAGYTCPVWTPVWDGRVVELLDHCRTLAPPGGVTAVLHVEFDSPLSHLMASAGWHVGVTDLYAVVEPIGSDRDDWLKSFPSKRRNNMRRELRRLADAHGHVELFTGNEILAVLDEVADLELEQEIKHDAKPDRSQLMAVNRALVTGFGKMMTMVIVRNVHGEAVASCSVFSGGDAVFAWNTGLRGGSYRNLAGYFHAGYHTPLQIGWQNGARRLLLGLGSLQPKLLRGARLLPLVSAIPPDAPGWLRRMLKVTDREMQSRWRQLSRESTANISEIERVLARSLRTRKLALGAGARQERSLIASPSVCR